MTRHIVATVGELAPGASKRVRAGGRDVALFRSEDTYYAIADRCPHEGASLCGGRIVGLAVSERPGQYRLERQGQMVRCPWHGWEFDLRTGQSWCDPERVRVRAFPTSVEAGAQVAKGPYVAETFPVEVERDYVLVEVSRPDWIEAVVTARSDRPGPIAVLDIARADGLTLPGFEAGAHVDVEVRAGLVRQYSLCGDPSQPETYRIAVLREAASRGGSAAAHDGLQVGRRVRISPPRNSFRLAARTARTILIGGGIGVTPLMSMAHALSRAGADYTLHYLARDQAHAAMLDELRAGQIGPHLQVSFSEAGSRLDLRSVLAAAPDAEIYVCGPARLIEAVSSVHEALGLAPSRLHIEHFTANVSKAGTAFQVEAARSGVTFDVPEGRTIAEMLLEHGIPVELSCEQGVCGTCMVAVLGGEPDHRDQVQTEADKAANRQITVCCSRARSARLVLDI